MGRKRKVANQNNSSTAKVVKEDDEKEREGGLNPLLMTEILPNILNYLDISNLKESRLVCKFWRLEGGKILLKESDIKLECFSKKNGQIPEKNEQLENFLNTTGISATFNSTIKNIKDPNNLKNILPLLLQRTTALSLSPSFSFAQGQKVIEFLAFFPNLQVLHFETHWGHNEVFSDDIKQSLLNKFESLKEIRLKFDEWHPFNLFNLLLTNNKKEVAVKEIHLKYNEYMFLPKYLESGCNWPIDTLFIEIWSLSPELLNTVEPFLEKISGSLKHLSWTFRHPQSLPNKYLVPWANNLINPSCLTELDTLVLFCEKYDSSAISATDFSWLLFTVALQLPNLKKLNLNKVPGNLEERIRKWNVHPNAQGRVLRSESLEELNIFHNERRYQQIPVESLTIFTRRFWPNLKFLYIEDPPNDLPASFLLSDWTGLERLDLKFETMSKKSALIWTNWFTGIEKLKEDNSCSLKDLKNLKHFGLWENWHGQTSRIASDFLVDNSLKFMTQLQSLYLENSNISWEVKEMLKETLGPNVNVEFKY